MTTTKQNERIAYITNKEGKTVFESTNTYKAYAVYNKFYNKKGYSYSESSIITKKVL